MEKRFNYVLIGMIYLIKTNNQGVVKMAVNQNILGISIMRQLKVKVLKTAFLLQRPILVIQQKNMLTTFKLSW
ncbi:hypothetical protein FD41_GL000370 [Lentilactobacillus farraginis DSM 18382 = JCM 14108]|uniref:Uncharacterized protein n=1 Tax=Lentilactobacillus farraginis DSM 18382 = JCM 14108 TaxID=1423743 RepID=A0A0R1VNV5_9LACO|nr:hypothetical protein FD41_GL000370 [Lentilactobacillus farraginis DSM 18382 = JCM 14108]